MKSIEETIAKIKEQKEILKGQKEILKGSLKTAIKEYLVAHPEVPYVAFCGYTPRFNDGDPCKFSCWPIEYDIESIAPSEKEETWTKYEDWPEHLSNFYNTMQLNEIVTIFGELYNTHGFQVAYHIVDGELKEELNDEYDCGY